MSFPPSAITPGDQITDMDGHKPTWKSYLDWEVYSPFKISCDMYDSVRGRIEALKGETPMNKMAYAVSSTTDSDGEVSSILIIYRYDKEYYFAILFSPKWKNVI